MKKIIAIAAVAAAISSPAFAARDIITPSGQADAIYQGSPLTDGVSKIVNQCFNRGWTVTSQTPNQVVCEVPVSTMTAVFQQLLIGNSYSTTPRTYVRFNLAQAGENTRVQANAWVETQMAFGQMRQQPYTDDGTFNGLMQFFEQSGGEPPPGSRYPGAYLGFGGQPASDGKRVTIPVLLVEPGSPAEAAGMKVGDRIIKVNGATFKDLPDLKKKVSKLGMGVSYPVIIERDGKAQTLTLVAAERPAVGTPEWVKMVAAQRAVTGAVPAPAAAATQVAAVATPAAPPLEKIAIEAAPPAQPTFEASSVPTK